MTCDLAEFLRARLREPLPGRAAQSRFEPELSFGRHYAPPPPDARHAAVMLLLYPQGARWLLPCTLRPETLSSHAGQVSLPGGLIEPGESSQDAALRELQEELGIDSARVDVLGQLSPLYLFVSNFSVVPWVGVLDHAPDFVPNPGEVEEVLEVPVEFLLDESNRGRHTHTHRDLSFSAPHFLWQGHRIWGATSMILSELVALVEEVPV
ncbi:MAG: CoA pyrophosphatase [Planctomycetaceae bacterium]|nr:CoA pyrophosphatase [Planctomycetaceae bacterium]